MTLFWGPGQWVLEDIRLHLQSIQKLQTWPASPSDLSCIYLGASLCQQVCNCLGFWERKKDSNPIVLKGEEEKVEGKKGSPFVLWCWEIIYLQELKQKRKTRSVYNWYKFSCANGGRLTLIKSSASIEDWHPRWIVNSSFILTHEPKQVNWIKCYTI